MREITREGCGVPDCIYNVKFRCRKKKIKVDEGSKCHSFKRQYSYRYGGQT